MKKIKVAFIKFAGLAAGGTEKYLQTLATNLPKDEFEVDYYYTHAAPLLGNSWKHPTTDSERKKYMESSGINLIHVSCAARDDRYGPPHEWVDTDFWALFDEEKYDIVQTGRSGYREYPFDRMKKSLFVDSIHGCGANGIEKRENIAATVLLSDAHTAEWLRQGGDRHKINIISPLVEMPPKTESPTRRNHGISDKSFVFGMHQGSRDDIFSPTPLEAYSLIENDETMFVMLGGSSKYRAQASRLGLSNIKFLDFTGNSQKIHEFVASLDVFSHGRNDGEVCSAAIIEALYHKKPVITHTGLNMGHLEQVAECGFMSHTASEYARYMVILLKNKSLYDILSERAWEKYSRVYSLETNIEKYTKLYRGIVDGTAL
tara:strand:- start:5315 stop:6436 length:1122 start_codon:yes stop_codon:yes gene_type:complete